MNFVSKEFNELTTKELYEILKSRAEIFVVEQNISYVDMDNADYVSRHFFLEDEGRVVGYLRAFYMDEEKTILKIGRVLSVKHGIGLGTELMNKTLEEIKRDKLCNKIFISAQKHAVPFYREFGFEVVSDEYFEEGIPHLSMEKAI